MNPPSSIFDLPSAALASLEARSGKLGRLHNDWHKSLNLTYIPPRKLQMNEDRAAVPQFGFSDEPAGEVSGVGTDLVDGLPVLLFAGGQLAAAMDQG